MFKFAIRIFVVAAIGYVAGSQLVERSLMYLLDSVSADLSYQAVRGQMHVLRTELDSIAPAARAERLRDDIQPLYGLGLGLLADADVTPSTEEQRQLATLGIIMRDDYNVYLAPLAGQPRQWLEVRLPRAPVLERWVTVGVWTALSLIVGIILLLLWALPLWRDLDRLRNATLRMGQGDLGARVRLSRLAGMRHVGESFNQMAERISALVENQRSLTNAVSHELRTPLARLSFEVAMLGQDQHLPKRHQILRDMQADICELETLVAELLVYARLERPTDDTVRLETVDTCDWLGEALAQVAHQAEARAIQCHVHRDYPPRVRLHPRYMSRALLNLVQNAVRYASRHVEVKLTQCPSGGFELIVDDDGGGIAPADRTRVFEPFIRLDESRDRGTGGAGLGLAIVWRVAASHGGGIEIHDSPLGGARFVLRWPA
ncbi:MULTISPECIES: ATP-binding protein [Achromobacter]|jgi:two-component system sensor kinase ParS|uniref:histidine kinase n=1 Tax=Achromobacter aegrifaciens TaxID=1287736 RepID=A0ABU2DC59_ACHAE|nr:MULTISPECIES: ATP-binding protein [Achromobacter]MBD9380236.1 ATP-binding protein [Achromobacter sp. ACM02]MBD9418609.1 ATP-binding protein [Achromobacter sp. ACM04]MBD9428996.1 ATP-binding protein [Achromobacter sp. ACM03]MBD9473688.1 ATP-binding protein [Achromobacter sp. ACM01]MDQ1760336.1 ATP-binding protein [Achromobacter aegrifaciens]